MVPAMVLPANRPVVILPVVVASVALVCLILKPFATDFLPLFHVIVRLPTVGGSLFLTVTRVVQLAGRGLDVWTNEVLPDFTPPPVQPETVPVDESLALTFFGLPSFGSGGLNVPVPAAFVHEFPAAAAGCAATIPTGSSRAVMDSNPTSLRIANSPFEGQLDGAVFGPDRQPGSCPNFGRPKPCAMPDERRRAGCRAET